MTVDEQYFAAFDSPRDPHPWAVFRTRGPTVSRYVPHRKAYVPMKDQWDWVAIGMSSDANGTRPVTAAEAEAHQAWVREVPEDLVKELEVSRP